MSLRPTSEIIAAVRAAQENGLMDAARIVAEQSDDNAPKDTKGLVQSRRIRPDPGGRRVAIRYGDGLDDPRAVINHEKTEIRHENGSAKYLERALASELPHVRRIIAAEIKKTLG